MLDAMGDMIGEDLIFGTPQRGSRRRKLRHNIDAIAVVLDHARQPAHLPPDPAETLEA